jgi:hypothetical protein
MPILPPLSGSLPQARRLALEDLFAEVQAHWAMVRFGAPPANPAAGLIAEVDFSGAPHSELLFSAGLDALIHGVARLVEIAGVLSDPSVAIASLAPGSTNNTTAEKGSL